MRTDNGLRYYDEDPDPMVMTVNFEFGGVFGLGCEQVGALCREARQRSGSPGDLP